MIDNQLISDFYRSQFQYPINWLQFHRYKKANLIGKLRTNAEGELCAKSGRIANQIPKLKCFENERKLKQRYGIYGPNCYLYFYNIKRFAIFMLIFSLLFGSPLLYVNAVGSCKQCFSESVAYKISLLNSIDSIEALRAQAFLWLIGSAFIETFLLWIRIKSYKKYDEVNERNITQSDYSIILRRVPYEAKVSDIEDLIYSDIRKDIQELIQKNEELLQKIRVKKRVSLSAKVEKQCISPKKQTEKNKKRERQINRKTKDLIRIKDIFWLHNMQETSKDFQKELNRFRQSIKVGSERQFTIKNIAQPSIYSDTVIVIFHRIQTRRFIHQIAKRSVCDEILNYFFPFISPLTQYRILGKNVSIYGAPQPSDILWGNVGHTIRQRVKRKCLSFIGLIILIALSGTIQYFLTLVKRNLSNDILGLVFSSLIVLSNSVIQALSLWAVKQQKLDTKTNLQSEIMMLYVFHQTINTGFFILIIPLVAKLPNLKTALLQANFPIIFLQTICILFSFIFLFSYFVEYFEVVSFFKIWLVKKGWIIKTQSQVNCELKGPSIMFSKKYSNLVKIFWFGLIFGIISPICIFISTVGILLLIPFQKALWNNKHSIPSYTGIRINETLFSILDWTVFQIGIVNFVVNYIMSIVKKIQMDKTIITVTIFNIVLGLAIVLFPYRLVFYRYGLHVNHKNAQNIDYSQAEKEFEQTYKTTNPKSSKRMTPIVNEKIINHQKNKKLDRFQSLEEYRHETFGKSLQHLVTESERKLLLRKAQTMVD